MKNKNWLWLILVLLGTSSAWAKDSDLLIESNTSSISNTDLLNNIVASANSMGARAPFHISETQENGKTVLLVSGSTHITCRVPVAGNPPHMAGISCQ